MPAAGTAPRPPPRAHAVVLGHGLPGLCPAAERRVARRKSTVQRSSWSLISAVRVAASSEGACISIGEEMYRIAGRAAARGRRAAPAPLTCLGRAREPAASPARLMISRGKVPGLHCGQCLPLPCSLSSRSPFFFFFFLSLPLIFHKQTTQE